MFNTILMGKTFWTFSMGFASKRGINYIRQKYRLNYLTTITVKIDILLPIGEDKTEVLYIRAG